MITQCDVHPSVPFQWTDILLLQQTFHSLPHIHAAGKRGSRDSGLGSKKKHKSGDAGHKDDVGVEVEEDIPLQIFVDGVLQDTGDLF